MKKRIPVSFELSKKELGVLFRRFGNDPVQIGEQIRRISENNPERGARLARELIGTYAEQVSRQLQGAFRQYVDRLKQSGLPSPFTRERSKEKLNRGFERLGIRVLDKLESVQGYIERFVADSPSFLRLLAQVDTVTQKMSQRYLKQLDQDDDKGKRRKLGTVVVGGGPNAALVAQILSDVKDDVTILCAENRLGGPWRARPFAINSSVDQNDASTGARLPRLQKGTTPISSAISEVTPGIEPALRLNDPDAYLEVICNDGSTRKYLYGTELGGVCALQLALQASEFLLGQRIDFTTIRRAKEGWNFTAIDQKTGVSRQFECEELIFCTGPQAERPQAQSGDLLTERLMKEAYRGIQTYIDVARERIAQGKLGEVQPIILPRILTLEMIEQLLAFWYGELEKNPQLYPFSEIFTGREQEFVVIGFGDSGAVLTEFLAGCWSKDAYIRSTGEIQSMLGGVTIIGTRARKKVQQAKLRRRYEEVLTALLNANRLVTAVDGQLTSVQQVNKAMLVQYEDEGRRRRNYAGSFVLVATGITPTTLTSDLQGRRTFFPSSSNRPLLDPVRSSGGAVGAVAAGENSLLITGTAAQLRLGDLPEPLPSIVAALGIPENTISLWLNQILTELAVWEYLAKQVPSSLEQARRQEQLNLREFFVLAQSILGSPNISEKSFQKKGKKL